MIFPALRCDEWNPPAQSEVLVKDGDGGEEEHGVGVREGAADGPHLLAIPDGDGGEQGDVQVSSVRVQDVQMFKMFKCSRCTHFAKCQPPKVEIH